MTSAYESTCQRLKKQTIRLSPLGKNLTLDDVIFFNNHVDDVDKGAFWYTPRDSRETFSVKFTKFQVIKTFIR